MSNLGCGILGLPNVGKSCLFNALTLAEAPSCNYPFCTIEPNMGIVSVVDKRLDKLSKITGSKETIYADMKFIDIAGLVKGASKGEGLGNKFLSHVRETDALIHVVRCFKDEKVTHVSGEIDPLSDIEIINLELILADLESAQSMLDKIKRASKGNKELLNKVPLLEKIITHLEKGKPIRTLFFNNEEKHIFKTFSFLTSKPVLYVANISEQDLPSMTNVYVEQVKKKAEEEDTSVIPICAKLEGEIASLNENERLELLQSYNLEETGLHRLIRGAFSTLGLITFFTTGPQETRAWAIKKGSSAAEAAGKIHTDIQKGFIRAEVIDYDDAIMYKGRLGAKEAGVLRSEGKEYEVKDGNVILFLHKE